jgi:hypothetical protein
MKGSFAFAVLFTALLCSGCSDSTLPTGPSSVRPGSLPLESAAGSAQAQESPVSSSTAQSVPFNGNLEGTQTSTPLQFPYAFVNGSATGNATHLGRFTVEFPHTVNFVTHTGEGTFTFTAANGDTLTATFLGLAQPGPIVSIEEHATIKGGTGRFAGATGTFTVQRLFNPASGATRGSFEGAISFAGAGHTN